jgi:RND family efflux transporter MFP subunit
MAKIPMIKVAVAALVVLCIPQSAAAQAVPNEDSRVVRTSTGVVLPDRSVTLSAKIVGRIAAINADEGDYVERGAILIDIDDSELQAELASAQVNLNQENLSVSHLEKLDKRYRNLYRQKSASAEKADETAFRYAMAREQVRRAQAAVDKVKAMLAETKITAPFSGVIVKRAAERGQVTSPGQPLLVLEDHSTLVFRTSVKEEDISHIEKGQTAIVTIDALNDLELDGRVSKLIPSGDLSTHEFEVELVLPTQDKLYPGMFGKADFSR